MKNPARLRRAVRKCNSLPGAAMKQMRTTHQQTRPGWLARAAF